MPPKRRPWSPTCGRTAAAYPADARLAALVERLTQSSPRFAELWFGGTVGAIDGDRKTIEHPELGDLVLDREVLLPSGSDLRIITYTAAADTSDADKPRALRRSVRPLR